MTGNEMLTTLGLRMEDPQESSFTQATKLDALNIAQKTVSTVMHNAYLTELQVVDTNKAMTSNTLAFSALSKTPYRNGVTAIKANGGKWANIIDAADQKELENSYNTASTDNPIAYVFDEKIYVDGLTATAGIDVWFIAAPTALAADGTECELNIALHEIVIDMAENQLWKMDNKSDRAARALSNATMLIDSLNSKYKGIA